MSEFKFACPVCGQHITADSSTSGSQLECPTCFQKIVVPQAPESGNNKFILSAAQVAKPRPTSEAAASQLGPLGSSARRTSLPALFGLLVFLCAAGAASFFFKDHILRFVRRAASSVTNLVAGQPAAAVAPHPTNPAPAKIGWTLELAKAVIPDTPLAGQIHGTPFACNTAVLIRGLLLCGEGTAPPYDLGFGVSLAAREAEELSGKTFEITPDRTNAPQVGWRWKNERQQPVTQIISNGYLLKVAFGQTSNGRMPGKVYVCLPDPDKSFAAGTFEAEIRHPPPPGTRPPRPPKP